MTDATAIAPWLDERRARSEFLVQQVPLAECGSWRFADGALRHATGRFFSVVGTQCHGGPPHLNGLALPMIDQPEIGVLGFVARRAASGWQWLLQAKTEPGNVHGTQIGPSVQATRSNYLQVHGGLPTAMIGLFTGGDGVVRQVTDVEQSEQGDRFLGKYNRNAVVEVEAGFEAPTGAWRWFDACAVRQALAEDFIFNTDARSVLCCTDWSLLCPPGASTPFGRWPSQEDFGARLLASNQAPLPASGLANALTRLEETRAAAALRIEPVPLDALPGWRCGAWAIECERSGIDPVVRAFRVHSADREVQDWCQPLLTNRTEGRAVLACARRGGVLHFLVPPRVEPGFVERAQFGPSLLTGLGHANAQALVAAIDHAKAITHLSVRQSDEGGRFKDSVARYQIVEIPTEAAQNLTSAGAWVTLSALRHMAGTRGLLSNELRSCLSLLLHWA
ncbi:MAG: NDP-hexose 2,3-dehydratase family protein [Ottowia sp.]|uniref:NDP-hexose 2,3-dehydratase family protein n=1 Tax=Ottowia sp. TaxID=1898956 RepID=UPI0039E38872